MASKPLEQVTLADLATKDDLENLVTKDDLARELGSAVNMIMGELGKIAARQEEQGRILSRLVAKADGVMR